MSLLLNSVKIIGQCHNLVKVKNQSRSTGQAVPQKGQAFELVKVTVSNNATEESLFQMVYS